MQNETNAGNLIVQMKLNPKAKVDFQNKKRTAWDFPGKVTFNYYKAKQHHFSNDEFTFDCGFFQGRTRQTRNPAIAFVGVLVHFLWKKRARPAKLRLKKHKMHLKKKWDIITCPLGHILQFIKSSALFQAKCLKAFSLQTKTFSTYFFGLKNEQLKAWNWAIKSLSVKSSRHKMQQLYLCTLSICPMSKDKRKKITFTCIIYPEK